MPEAKIVSISKSSLFIRFIFMVDSPKLVHSRAKNEDSDQTARMRRLIWFFVVRIHCTILIPAMQPTASIKVEENSKFNNLDFAI